jgi:DNA-binding transcriptional LysR family regulator
MAIQPRREDMTMLDIHKLVALREIAIRGSFSAAAAQLHYSQSAISQQIAGLERETGTPLFERRGRGVQLTAAGRLLVDHAERVLSQLAVAEADLEAITGCRRRPLRLAAFASAAATFAPAAILGFRSRHPEVPISMTIADSDLALSLLTKGDVDIAIVNRTEGPQLSGAIASQDLVCDPLLVALPPGHPLRGRRVVDLADLAGESWTLASGPTCADSNSFETACRRAGFEPAIAFRSDDYLALQGFVAAGLGVALLPSLVARTVRDGILVRPLGPGALIRSITAITLAGIARSPSIAAMLDELRESAKDLAQEPAPSQ